MIFDFITGTVSSVLGNAISKAIESLWGPHSDSETPKEFNVDTTENEDNNFLFKTFGIKFGLESIVSIVPDPVLHIFRPPDLGRI